MYCNKCGKQITDNSTFCEICGASQGANTNSANLQDLALVNRLNEAEKQFTGAKTSRMAGLIMSIIFGIITLILLVQFIQAMSNPWGSLTAGFMLTYIIPIGGGEIAFVCMFVHFSKKIKKVQAKISELNQQINNR